MCCLAFSEVGTGAAERRTQGKTVFGPVLLPDKIEWALQGKRCKPRWGVALCNHGVAMAKSCVAI